MKSRTRPAGKVLAGMRRQRANWKRRLGRIDVLITSFALGWLLVRFMVFALRSSR